jgi:hypothetical protein
MGLNPASVLMVVGFALDGRALKLDIDVFHSISPFTG